MTSLEQLQRTWDELGHADPMWAILTDPRKRGNRWDRESFFETGRQDIGQLFEWIEEMDALPARGRALDFGCGVGRLTQALAARFDEIVGVDIAPRMIEPAREFNTRGDRCAYVLNDRDDLGVFGDASFDFVYTVITLQHMEPRFSKRYLAEFVRILRPGGLLIFQLPDRPDESVGWIRATAPAIVRRAWRRLKRAAGRQGLMEMHGIPRETVVGLLESAGAEVVAVRDNDTSAPGWHSLRYAARRAESGGVAEAVEAAGGA